jgi:uncharacterized protein YgiM (DUF1202 family)
MASSFRDLARQLREAEEPLQGLYRELRAAAATRVEQELSGHLMATQASQMAYLALMGDELPSRFIALGTICSQATKLRDGAGGNHRLLAELPAGTPVIVMEWAGYWAHVQLPGGRRGYVFRDYVRAEGGAKEAPAWQQSG